MAFDRSLTWRVAQNKPIFHYVITIIVYSEIMFMNQKPSWLPGFSIWVAKWGLLCAGHRMQRSRLQHRPSSQHVPHRAPMLLQPIKGHLNQDYCRHRNSSWYMLSVLIFLHCYCCVAIFGVTFLHIAFAIHHSDVIIGTIETEIACVLVDLVPFKSHMRFI